MMMNNRVCYHIFDGTLTSQKYLEFLRTVVWPFVNSLSENISVDCWYQMDGVPAHNTIEVHQQLDAIFADRWIGRNGPWHWPVRSPDLTPCDFHLWGVIKSKVYEVTIESREELIERIRQAFTELDPTNVRRATTSGVHSRLSECLRRNGGHFEHFL